MRTRLSASAAVVSLLVLVAVPTLAAPVLGRDNHDAARARHDSIVRHWTEARLRAAVPRDKVVGPRKARPKPTAAAAGSVSGASWGKGGAILRASGKVYFEMGGSGWVCSGSVARDTRSGYSLVLTAGHCAYDEANRAFATNWLFIPEFDSAPTFTCGSTKWGCWTADALVVNNGYASSGSFNSQAMANDFAFAVVGPGGKGGGAQLDATVGSFPIAFSGVAASNRLYAFGYPAIGKYHGSDLTYCAGAISNDSMNANLTWRMTCDMTGGASGGPWLSTFSEATGSGTLGSLNSYRYTGVKAMFGPKFNASTQAVYFGAEGATANTIVP